MVKDDVDYFFKTFYELLINDSLNEERVDILISEINQTVNAIIDSQVTMSEVYMKMLIHSHKDISTSIVSFNYLMMRLEKDA